MADFMLYGLDGAGDLVLTEPFVAPDLTLARQQAVEKGLARALATVEVWQQSVCVLRQSLALAAAPPASPSELQDLADQVAGALEAA